MTLAPSRTHLVDARSSFLVLVGWYVAVVVSFGLFLTTLSGSVPAACGEVCDSERSRALLFGLYVATPALFLALLVSLAMLSVLVARTRIRSSALLGSLSAVPPLALCGIVIVSL
ncbi:hypothetical protein ACLQ3H_11360 [Micromonospora saelicesensis]|uniref:hypothetical protein n=1 Tax=Micromonospora saelicesensis TaxID=285676 RepID=UPI000DC043CB|nr:hypothetical protein [Micromonospora saelicesensis]RAO61431.1 hypothetical protein LUPAC06_00902 [Micromonospora saelicesensis]